MSLNSCRPSKPAGSVNVQVDIEQNSDASTMFSSYSYVPLETTEESIFSEVRRLEADDDMIYVQSEDVILIFDRNGRYINKISKKGLGPEEYLAINDFKVRDGQIWVLSSQNKAIFIYTREGGLVRKLALDNQYHSFSFYDGSVICLSSESCNDRKMNFVFFDTDSNETVAEYDPFDRHESMIFRYPTIIGRDGGDLYVTHPFDYTVYRVGESGFKPDVTYSFNTKDHLDADSTTSYIDKEGMAFFKNVVCHLTIMHETDDYTYLVFPLFSRDGGILSHLVQFKDGVQQNHRALCYDMDQDYPYIDDPLAVYKDELISVMNPTGILYIEENNGLHLFKDKHLDEDDNPVVFFHKLR